MSKKEKITEAVDNQEVIAQVEQMEEPVAKENIFKRIGKGIKNNGGKIAAGAVGLTIGVAGTAAVLLKALRSTGDEGIDCEPANEEPDCTSDEVTE